MRKGSLRKLGNLSFLIIVVLISFVLSACGQTATPASSTGTIAPTTASVSTTAPASEVTTPVAVPIVAPTTTVVAVVTTQPVTATVRSPLLPETQLGPAGLPVYVGANSVELSEGQEQIVDVGQPAIKALFKYPYFDLYQVNDVKDSTRLVQFYNHQLSNSGWTNQTDKLALFTNQLNFSALDADLALYTKGDLVALVGVSKPLTAATIQTLKLGQDFAPGDIAIITMTGLSNIKL